MTHGKYSNSDTFDDGANDGRADGRADGRNDGRDDSCKLLIAISEL